MGIEAFIFIVMVGSFILLSSKWKLPIGLALLAASVLGALIGGEGLGVRHIVEGGFMYLDAILIIVSAMALMGALRRSGALSDIARQLVQTFGRRPIVLLPALMLLTMLPGMLSGSSTAAVLTTGGLVGPVLITLGLSRARAGALIAMGGIYGMIAPPVNLPVMLIGAGIDIPYVGFEGPLLIASVPLAIATAYWAGWPLLRHGAIDVDSALAAMEASLAGAGSGAAGEEGGSVVTAKRPLRGFWAWAPLIWVVLSMISSRFALAWTPDFGLALTFAVGALLTIVASGDRRWLTTLRQSVGQALPVLGILVGVGAFIQVLTLVGGRGWIVVSLLSMPAAWLYVSALVGVPLFGAVSAYGAASVLGVPFVLAFLETGNVVVITSALSLLAGLGDLMPPTALAGIFAAQVVGEKRYVNVLKQTIVPALATMGVALAMILLA